MEENTIVEVEEGSPIHGDLLEVILARVPLIDLVWASRVSKSWARAVSSSLHLNKVKPWLVIDTQCRRSLKKKAKLSYDPRSDLWIELNKPVDPSATQPPSPLQSSNSTFLYELSSNKLSFSVDPLHLSWHDISPPRAWRVDPIVTRVGSNIVVAGGASGFYEDPLSVEMYDMETSQWSTCQPMPDILKHSAASTWLSVASNQELMYVVQNASGMSYTFSPDTRAWAGPYDLKPDPSVYFSAVGFSGDNLILAGLIGGPDEVKALKIWKIDPESMGFEQIGEMPTELLEKLKGEAYDELTSVSLMAAKDFVYICNSSNPEEIVLFECVGGEWKWASVKNVAWNDDRKIGERMVMSCGKVGIGDLQSAMKAANLNLLV